MLDFYSRYLDRFGLSVALYLMVGLGTMLFHRPLGIPPSAVPWIIGGTFIAVVVYQLIVMGRPLNHRISRATVLSDKSGWVSIIQVCVQLRQQAGAVRPGGGALSSPTSARHIRAGHAVTT